MRRNTLTALQVFRDLGAEVTEIETDFPRTALHSGMEYLAHIFGAYLAPLLERCLADPRTRYANIHTGRPGCFLCRRIQLGDTSHWICRKHPTADTANNILVKDLEPGQPLLLLT